MAALTHRLLILPSSPGLSSHTYQYTNQHYDENISSARDIYPLLVFSGPHRSRYWKTVRKVAYHCANSQS